MARRPERRRFGPAPILLHSGGYLAGGPGDAKGAGLGQLLQGRLLMAIIQVVLAAVLWFFLLGWAVHINGGRAPRFRGPSRR